MDMESGKQQFITFLKKYQSVFWVVLVGVFLMLIPPKQEKPQPVIPDCETALPDLEKELAALLGRISGVGKAEVLLTEASGYKTIYQTDPSQNQSTWDTVIVMDGNRAETGLIQLVESPVYKGAVIVCQGADSAAVRLAVVDAVKSVTGLSSDCITVLKMK